ncbi:transcriptional regulator with XRE-family HTH domain [Paraburkholderia sp. RAU2J]|uniref:helix-turn-helix domain-containing protein n=1 Tax=Paraburkholderia sp. RAU2J TaxID=1938810 RepID=UPI000EACAF3E|nr:helix-turn-helix transcriptional regulator [Paraburkholderia sp. RAU2J]RKT13453.1 transcriptional regulator with XRE-family HTH domain [Paraburkholderia sp. RAU2J]
MNPRRLGLRAPPAQAADLSEAKPKEQRRILSTQERVVLRRIGDALARARLEVRMTQEEVSAKIGVNTETISRFERGHTAPTLLRLFELAAIYGVPPETFIAGGGGRSSEPARDIAALLVNLSAEDREFIRQLVANVAGHMAKK